MKSIDTLVSDILGLFSSGRVEAVSTPEAVTEFSDNLAKKLKNRLTEERSAPTLRLSNMGKPCERQLWYSINRPEKAEPLEPETRIKFLYGDILEEMILYLAKEAGHTVTGEQDELRLHGVLGHRDAIIDGVLVDVKSASSYSFDKFNSHLTPEADGFGYIGQLDSYLHSADDLLVKDFGAFLVIDKTLGKICLDKHPRSNIDYEKVVQHKREMLAKDTPPPRAFTAEPDGKSGNLKLGITCSYCPFKKTCWPGVRVFNYYNGPRFLTVVRRTPDVPEIT